jgi:hypothetical protein
MSKSYRTDDLNQSLLLPPSLHDWLPENHLARFLVDVVYALDRGDLRVLQREGRSWPVGVCLLFCKLFGADLCKLFGVRG